MGGPRGQPARRHSHCCIRNSSDPATPQPEQGASGRRRCAFVSCFVYCCLVLCVLLSVSLCNVRAAIAVSAEAGRRVDVEQQNHLPSFTCVHECSVAQCTICVVPCYTCCHNGILLVQNRIQSMQLDSSRIARVVCVQPQVMTALIMITFLGCRTAAARRRQRSTTARAVQRQRSTTSRAV